MTTPLVTSHLFTPCLWPEPRTDGGTAWRGKVTHVFSGETRYFREWQALLDFLADAPANPSITLPSQLAIAIHRTAFSEEIPMNDEFAQRYCLMVSQEVGEGRPGSAVIWHLDWLDDQGVPHAKNLSDHCQDGWWLVQVIERPASEGICDGPVGRGAYYYFTRPARTKR